MRTFTVFFVLSLFLVSFAEDLPQESPSVLLQEEQKNNLISLLSANSTYVIDDVLALLQALLDDSTEQLADLETQWSEDYPELSQTFNNISSIVENMKTVCKGYWDTASEINDTINTISNKMQEYQDIITKNEKRVDILHDTRCQTNQNYILSLVKSKNALALIRILRQAIQDFNNQNFLQIGMKKLNSIAEALSHMARKDKKFLNMLQQLVPNVPDVSERTSNTPFIPSIPKLTFSPQAKKSEPDTSIIIRTRSPFPLSIPKPLKHSKVSKPSF